MMHHWWDVWKTQNAGTAGTALEYTDSLAHWCYISSCSSGLAPLIIYGELQRDMGPYRTVHIALYMFTLVYK